MQYTDGERLDLRLDYMNERVASLEQRIYYLENAVKELLYEKSSALNGEGREYSK